MAGAPRICTVMSEQTVRVKRGNLHRLDGVVCVLDGLDLDMLDGVREEELVEDVELVVFACADGLERVHGQDATWLSAHPCSPEKELVKSHALGLIMTRTPPHPPTVHHD